MGNRQCGKAHALLVEAKKWHCTSRTLLATSTANNKLGNIPNRWLSTYHWSVGRSWKLCPSLLYVGVGRDGLGVVRQTMAKTLRSLCFEECDFVPSGEVSYTF